MLYRLFHPIQPPTRRRKWVKVLLRTILLSITPLLYQSRVKGEFSYDEHLQTKATSLYRRFRTVIVDVFGWYCSPRLLRRSWCYLSSNLMISFVWQAADSPGSISFKTLSFYKIVFVFHFLFPPTTSAMMAATGNKTKLLSGWMLLLKERKIIFHA